MLSKEDEYLSQYPHMYRDVMRNTIREVLDIVQSRCTLIRYQPKGKRWLESTPTDILSLTGKNFARFEAMIKPGGMYAVVKDRISR